MTGGSSQFSAGEYDALVRARQIYLATVRRDGTQSKAAPLWFTVTAEHTILVQSGPESWHGRRIRRGSRVLVWIGRRCSPAFIGRAEITNDPAVVEQITNDYARKYLMARLGLHRPTMRSFKRGKRVAIKITPVGMLPQGFKSQPGAPAPSLADPRTGLAS